MQNSQENTCARVSFIIKLQAFRKIHKKTPVQGLFYNKVAGRWNWRDRLVVWNWIDNHFGLCESICSNVTFQISLSYRRKKSWTNRPEYRTLRYTENDFVMVSISIIYLHIFFPILKVIINQFWILSLNFAYAANLAKAKSWGR